MSGAEFEGFGFRGFSDTDGMGFGKFSDGMDFGFSNHNPIFSFISQEKENSNFSPQPRISFTAQDKSMSSCDEQEEEEENDIVQEQTPSPKKRKRKKLEWVPLTSDAEFCPTAIFEYINTPLSKRRKSADLNLKVKKHLLSIGWEIKFVKTQNGTRASYISPDGKKTYMSLTQVCSELNDSLPEINPPLMETPQKCKKLSVSVEDSGKCSSQAVVDYISFCEGRIASENKEKTVAKIKARDHLENSGWNFFFAVKKNKNELRYKAPSGKVFYSLLRACKWFAEQNSLSPGGVTESDSDNAVQNLELPRNDDVVEVLGEFSNVGKSCFRESINAQDFKDSDQPRMLVNAQDFKQSDQPRMLVNVHDFKHSDQPRMLVNATDNAVQNLELPRKILKARDDFEVLGKFSNVGKSCFRESINAQDVKDSDQPRVLVNATDNAVQNLELPRKILQPGDDVEILGKFGNVGKSCYLESRSSINAQGVKDSDQPRMLVIAQDFKDFVQPRMLIKSQDVKDSDQSRMQNSSSAKSTILSCLIDNNVVLPEAKVQYRKKDGRALKDGKITRDGIQCNCCQQIYGLSNFEAHAKSTYHRPSAFIFLEDGRSLFDCQKDMKLQKANVTNSKTKKSHDLCIEHDDICSVCLDFGELLLCDLCPSSFHASCLGLKDIPPGDWFCPSCCCGICRNSQFDRNKNQITDNTALSCYQCEHSYHIGCLRSNCLLKLDYLPEGKWFCNYRCEQVFSGLNRILGKQIPVGYNNLTWTLLKSTNQIDSYHSKLSAALDVMHECFSQIEERRTKRDLIVDVIFSRWSELKRLNFQGFYTVILEINNEVVTVATLRVHGEKVAEIPLVGTLFKYRRLGMCRVLMNQLEKKLAELGVQRLVLPALPDAINTWTGSFGFSVMTKAERQIFLDNTFLYFHGTVMCQKLLPNNPSIDNSRESQKEHADDDIPACQPVCAEELDGNSTGSKDFVPIEFDLTSLFYQEPEEFIKGDN